jgi:L-lactate dehydrogenase
MSKISVVGAGAVGTATAYALLIKEVASEVTLYDIDAAKVEAEVLDLAHGTQFTGSSRMTGGSDIKVTSNSDLIIITAGAKQKPGQTRLDLAAVNVEILKSLLPKLLEHSPNAIFMLVTNPCDVLAVVAQRITALPANRIFASGTVLDSARLRWVIAERFKVSSNSVHAHIVGEHGDSEFVLWSQTRIGPVPITEWELSGGEFITSEELNQMALDVKNAAYKVIAGKGATNYAIGLSATRIAEAILTDSNDVLSISTVLENYQGVSGVALSVPAIVNRSGAARTVDVPMTEAEKAKFLESAAAIEQSLNSLGYGSKP